MLGMKPTWALAFSRIALARESAVSRVFGISVSLAWLVIRISSVDSVMVVATLPRTNTGIFGVRLTNPDMAGAIARPGLRVGPRRCAAPAESYIWNERLAQGNRPLPLAAR